MGAPSICQHADHVQVDLVDLIEFLLPPLTFLWKEWPLDFIAVSLPPPMGLFSLRGTCPHPRCRDRATFTIVSINAGDQVPAIHIVDRQSPVQTVWAIMQCQGCLGFILGCAVRRGPEPWQYIRHYPIGEPDDSLSPDIPIEIAHDFKQALRCRWVKAYGATVLMCRRSLQVSCDMEQAQGKDLFKQIDDLATKQRITETLKKWLIASGCWVSKEHMGTTRISMPR